MKNSWMIFSLPLLAIPMLAISAQMKFYAGLGAGAAYYSAESSKTLTTQPIFGGFLTAINETSADAKTTHFSGAGQVQLGGGVSTQRFYLGLEALGQLSNGEYDSLKGGFDFIGVGPDGQVNHFVFETKLHMNDFEPAIDLKPGIFLFSNTLLYGRIGAAFNEITLTDTTTYDLTNSIIQGEFESSESEDVTALRLGFGLELPINKKFTLFADYTYTIYPDSISFTRQDVLSGTVPTSQGGYINATFINDSEMKASDLNKQVALLGFNYYF